MATSNYVTTENSDRIGRQIPYPRNRIYNPEYVSLMDNPAYNEKLKQWGIVLFPWQINFLRDALAMNGNAFAYQTCGLTVPRQNGKTLVIIARILLGCIMFREIQLFTAQIKKTATSVFNDIRALIANNAHLRRFFPESHQASANPNTMSITAVDPKTGKVLGSCEFVTRGGPSVARGQTFSVTYFDEAQLLTEKQYADVTPTAATGEKGQEFFIGTASSIEGATQFGKQASIKANGQFFLELREGIKSGRESDACWLEWGVDAMAEKGDLDAIYDSNPSLGFKMKANKSLSLRKLVNFRGSVETFNTEHLGYWPSQAKGRAIDISQWDKLSVNQIPKDLKNVRTAVALKPNDNGGLDIVVAARTAETTYLNLLPQINMNTEWAEPLWEILGKYLRSGACKSIVIDGKTGQFEIMSLLAAKGYWNLHKAGSSQRKVSVASPLDMAQATSTIITSVTEKTISPLIQPFLRAAVEDAGKRSGRGGGFIGFNSLSGKTDTNCLEAAALALHAAMKQKLPTSDPDDPAETKKSNPWGESVDWG